MNLGRPLWTSLCVFALILGGCSSSRSNVGSVGDARHSGSVHGGQQPVVGASIQLYAVGTTGDGSAATPLLTAAVASDASGSFTITGLYSCTDATQVYIVATGGNPGLSAANPNIALMAALGPCSSLTSSTFININELTTVAAVSSLAPYMNSITAIGSNSTDASSLANAFTVANQLVNTATGASPGTNVPSGYTVPTAELNTLADIVSACINSAGGTAGDGSLCGSLFSAATAGQNPAPTDTIAALRNLALNPSQNASALYALLPPTPPFQPTLTSAPSSFQAQLVPASGGTSLLLSPAVLNFPDTAVGFTSQPQTVTIENTGNTFAPGNFSLEETNSADFTIVNPNCGSAIAPGSSCTVQVEATPTALGARSANLVVDNANSSPQYVSLSVNGINPVPPPASAITLTPSLSFTILGALEDLTLSNSSNVPLAISSITESDPSPSNTPYFKIFSNTCGTSLPAQSVCTITVVSNSSPDPDLEAVTYTGTVTVNDNASSSPLTASLQSQDNYQSPTLVTFPANQVGYKQTMSNAASFGRWTEIAPPAVPLTISGADAGDFSISAEAFGGSGLPSTGCYDYGTDGFCEITFSFTPQAAGLATAKVSLDPTYGTPTGQYFLLQGTGVGPGPSFTLNTSSLNVSNNLPGNIDPNSLQTQTVTLTNTGTTTVNLGVNFTGTAAPYLSLSATNCTAVAPQATCQFTVSFNSPTVGSYTGSAVFKDINSTFTLPVTVSASTQNWTVISNPSSVAFGYQAVGTTSAAKSFTLSDFYGYPLGHAYSVTLQPSSNFVLTQGSTCPASTTQTCTLAVAFAPQTTGTFNETATITDQTTGAQSGLSLTGTGGGPSYSLSPTSVVFPVRSVNTTSVPTVVTLTSNGMQNLIVTGISIAGAVNGNFSETNNCGSVAANSTCSINVTFAPTSTGAQSATLQITSNAVNSPSTIALSGTAQ